MAPLRRYLRITPYSILEVRIYLDNPADLHRWLIHPTDPKLPEVLQAVKPFVLPKLREENARAAGRKTTSASSAAANNPTPKPKGKKGVRDVVVTDSFEVSVFLTELSTPHSVLVRSRHFAAKESTRAGGGLASGTEDAPVVVPEEDEEDLDPDRDDVQLLRQQTLDAHVARIKSEGPPLDSEGDTVPDHDENDELAGHEHDVLSVSSGEGEAEDEKKKLGLTTSYDGFQIYGRILALVVKRKDKAPRGIRSLTGNAKGTTADSSIDNGTKSKSGSKSGSGVTAHKASQQNIAEMVQRSVSTTGRDDDGEGIMEGWMRSTQIGNDSHGISGGRVGDDSDGEGAG